jgi:hypothetical protein
VLRFFKGYLSFEPCDSDIYVASYPRSGTTWMQYILCLLTRGLESGFGHIGEVVPWWERSLALRLEAPQNLAALPDPRVFKTHLPLRWLPARGRYIYLYRNGPDVAVSYFHLYRRYLGFDGTFEQFFDRFMEGRLQYGSWFKHVAGWKAHMGHPRLIFVRYEDLKKEPKKWVEKVARFCDLPSDNRTIGDVVQKTRFDRMKVEEEKFDHAGELLINRGVRKRGFIRSGRIGDSHNYLTETQKQRFRRACAAPIGHPDLEWKIADFLH